MGLRLRERRRAILSVRVRMLEHTGGLGTKMSAAKMLRVYAFIRRCNIQGFCLREDPS